MTALTMADIGRREAQSIELGPAANELHTARNKIEGLAIEFI
jgi:hypothetical protein